MSSLNLERLTADFPEDADAVKRLVGFIETCRQQKEADWQFSADRFYNITKASSKINFARILQRLLDEGVLEEIVRVESENFGGLGDFRSTNDVPRVLHDWRRDMDFEVRPEHLHLYYKLQP